jgi:NAD(P)-dependent dehydrogenase (short-subunit alcohol dehydrogenase family)
MQRRPSAAVTGAGGGLGRAIAEALEGAGYRVYGAVRNPSEVRVGRSSKDGIEFAQCDVTDAGAVATWAGRVSATVGDGGLDVLVSNAGVLTVGPLKLTTLDVVRRDFEVNVFGSTAAVVNAFLPALRAARGRIVQIGSVTGRLPVPFAGVSSAAKAAMEALVDALPQAPTRVPVGEEATEMVAAARRESDDTLDALRLGVLGLEQ